MNNSKAKNGGSNNIDNYYSLWGLQVNNNSELISGGCSIVDITKQYGTPLFIVDHNHLKKVCKGVVESFRKYYSNTKIFYSYKTNTVPGILKEIHKFGIGAEVTTGYELQVALKQGIRDIIFNGPCKTKEDLRIAIENSIRMINIDSEEELRILFELAKETKKEIPVGVRITDPYKDGDQFGFNNKTGSILKIFQKIKENRRLLPEGIHIHAGSNIKSLKNSKRIIKTAMQIIDALKDALNIDIKVLNIGGGLGIHTVKTLSLLELAFLKLLNIPPSPSKLSTNSNLPEKISFEVNKYIKHLKGKPVTLFVEPGRILTASSQMLILKVVSVKNRGRNKRYAVLDGGAYNNAFPLLSEYHKCIVVNRLFEKEKYYYTLVGPSCTPSDIMYRNVYLQKLEKGDLIAIMDAGAYFLPLSSNFGFPKPAVVGLSQGKSWLIKKREDFEYMSAMDLV